MKKTAIFRSDLFMEHMKNVDTQSRLNVCG